MDDRTLRAAGRIEGRPAAPGLALGPFVRLAPVRPLARESRSAAEEHQALADALAASQADLAVLAGEVADAEAEAILSFQIALLEDDNLAAPALARIAGGEAAHLAWHAAMDGEIASYEEAEDSYFRARASDLRDLRDRVLRHLAGEAEQRVPAGAVVAADDMPPSTFLATDWRDGGLVLRRGSPSSHVAILARSRGVPMIVGVDIDRLEAGAQAMLDGDSGILIVDPDSALRADYARRRAEQAELRKALASFTGPASTARGEPVRVMINVTGLAELGGLDPAETDGIGLMRTEFLFQGRDRPADRGRAIPDLPPHAAMGGRPAGDHPHPGCGRRQADCRPDAGRRPQPVPRRPRRAAVAAASRRVRRAIAGAGPRRGRGQPQGDDPDGDGARGTRSMPRPAGRGHRRFAPRRPGRADAAARHDGRGAGGGIDHRGFQRRFLFDRQQRFDPVCRRREPRRAAARRAGASIPRGVPADRPCRRSMPTKSGREASLCGDLAGDPGQVAALLDQGLRVLSVAPGALRPVKAAISRYSGPKA